MEDVCKEVLGVSLFIDLNISICRVVQPVWRSYGMARHLNWRSLIE